MIAIAFIPYIIILVVIITSAILAFRTQKNWATLTFLTGSSLYFIIILYSSYLTFSTYTLYSSSSSQPFDDNSQLYYDLIGIATYIITFTVIIGITGYMFTSRSIYRKSEELSRDNQTLADKLNQL